jgi:hypothetical protein
MNPIEPGGITGMAAAMISKIRRAGTLIGNDSKDA